MTTRELLTLSTIAVRDGQFTPGAGAEHAFNRFSETSRDECDAFLTTLVRIARRETTPLRVRALTDICRLDPRVEQTGFHPVEPAADLFCLDMIQQDQKTINRQSWAIALHITGVGRT